VSRDKRLVLKGRVIKAGCARGVALVSPEPIGFLGGVDPDTGVVVEPGHPLEGQSVAGRVLVFPTGKGSTVGSYTLYRLARNGVGPAAIISDIPMVDQVDIAHFSTGDDVVVKDEVVRIE